MLSRISACSRFVIAACLSFLIIVSSMVAPAASALAASSITIDTPASGGSLTWPKMVLTGTYTGLYDIKLSINGESQVSVTVDDPDADDAGTWRYELDTRDYSGIVRLRASGSDVQTRYGVWSQTLELQADPSRGAAPQVAIVSPVEGNAVSGTVPVTVAVYGDMPVLSVQVRVNGGPWQHAIRHGKQYVFSWNTKGLGDVTSSIEAKATDVRGRTGFSSTIYATVGRGTHEQITVKPQDRAMWIWEPEAYRLLLNPGSRTVLDAFAKDTATFGSEPVTTMYLAVGPMADMDILADEPGKLRSFIAWAHSQGYQVYACISGGTTPPYMGAYTIYHDKAVREMERVLNYNIASSRNERFDGVNVDIEPYISPDFKDEYPSLQLQYLDMLKKMIDRRNATGLNLPFGPAIPKWFDSSAQAQDIIWNGSSKWLSQHVQDMADYISIMDYRDTADGSAGIIAGAQGEIDYADAIGKPHSVVIAVESLDIANSGDPETITFREEGRTVMEAELDKVYAAYGGRASFGGIAMHHYDSLRSLPSYWGPGSVTWQPPADTKEPSAIRGLLKVQAVDYQRAELSYGMASDDTDIDRYVIYRGATPWFTPGPDLVAGESRSLTFRDTGLLPDTVYYYKVAARDVQGKIGPATGPMLIKTKTTALKPMILTGMSMTMKGTAASVTMQVVDKNTRLPLADALVEGRFQFAGGKYTGGRTDANGMITLISEAIPIGRLVGFEPRRVTSSGYYWAQAYDEPHTVSLNPLR
ncbi:Ig-like domain-containing protein [Paenibacillus sp. UNC451MF]|uniref:Ig-like domain-containing protein n=1 Tax=Paenibacillus sp. UNC451MF TaxID=1449063 RepID=UPI0006905B46|nr:Ig-like domain-containing protein [Paenibacillus sp. UNC451MF]